MGGVMNKWLIGIYFLFVLFGSFLLGNTTHAASIYDDTYQLTDRVLVRNDISGGSLACNNQPVDISQDWSSYILDEDKWVTANNQANGAEDVRDSFKNAINNGRWGVSTYYENIGVSGDVIANIYWTEDTSLQLTWQDAGSFTRIFATSQTSDVYVTSIICADANGQGDRPFARMGSLYTNQDVFNWSVVSNSQCDFVARRGVCNYLVYTDYPNYPTGYDGIEIRQAEVNPCPDGNCVSGGKWQPSFDIAWNDLDITLTDKTPLDKIDEYNIDRCYWGVFDGNWDDLNLTGEYPCDDHTPVEYTLPTYESYQINLNYYDSENGILYTAEYLVNIDGGSGSDSINDPFYSTAIGRVFKKHMDSDYGLEKFFLAPINFVASLPSKVGHCTPINYTLMGEHVQLNCLSQTAWNRPTLSTIVNFYQVIMLATVTFFVATGVYGVIKSATNPLDDKIDVLRL